MTDYGKQESICRQCSKVACPLVNPEDRRAVVECKSFTHREIIKAPEFNLALAALQHLLPAEIDKEQDDVLNGYLVDMFDAAEGYLKVKGDKEYREFQEDPA